MKTALLFLTTTLFIFFGSTASAVIGHNNPPPELTAKEKVVLAAGQALAKLQIANQEGQFDVERPTPVGESVYAIRVAAWTNTFGVEKIYKIEVTEERWGIDIKSIQTLNKYPMAVNESHSGLHH